MASTAICTGEQMPRSSSSSSRRRLSQDEPQEQEKIDEELTIPFDNVLAQEKFLKEIKCRKSWWTLVIHLRESDSALAGRDRWRIMHVYMYFTRVAEGGGEERQDQIVKSDQRTRAWYRQQRRCSYTVWRHRISANALRLHSERRKMGG